MSTEVIIIEKQEEEEPIEFLWNFFEEEWLSSSSNPKSYDKIECLPYKDGLHIFIAHDSGSISIFKGILNSGKVE